MEKNINDVVNLATLSFQIQQKIATHLTPRVLGFFARSNKQTLKNFLPLLHHCQTMFSSQLTSKGNSTYFSHANQLFVCGRNSRGQLGLGDQANRSTFIAVPWPEERSKIVQVSAGKAHTLVLTTDNQLWVCGYNEQGQLGLGDKMDRSTFSLVPWPEERCQIQQVIAGGYHSLIITQDNQLWGCGFNRFGQLGLGDKVNRSTFSLVPWPIDQGKIQEITAGGYHTIMATQDNQLWGCGSNVCGQLGLGDKEHRYSFTAVPLPANRGRIKQAIAGWDHTVVFTEDNQLWVCGVNDSGQLGVGGKANCSTFNSMQWPADCKIKAIAVGGLHTMVLTENNQLWVCGSNDEGQLGLRHKKDRLTFTSVPWLAGQGKISQVIAGGCHTIVLTQGNQLWVCGSNDEGQLGLGNKEIEHFTFTLVRELSEIMKQSLMFNYNFNQLIKIGTSTSLTTLAPDKESDTLSSQGQDELEEQLKIDFAIQRHRF